MNRRALVWLFAVAVLALSPLDDWLDREMPRLILLEMPAWIALGWLAGRRIGQRRHALDPHGLSGLAFFVGALGFWMIPRSVDVIAVSEIADQSMHVSLLTAGAALAASLPSMPFVVRGAVVIYGASMTFALAMVYTSYSALLCGTFNLAQQRATGGWLLMACPAILVLVIASGARALGRESRYFVRSRSRD